MSALVKRGGEGFMTKSKVILSGILLFTLLIVILTVGCQERMATETTQGIVGHAPA